MVRRVMFATFWFVIFWLALLVAGLGITDSLQARPSPGSAEGFRTGYEAGAAAGADFRARYGWVVLTVAGLLAAGGSIAGVLPGTRK